MENNAFRSSLFGGFRRQDVIDYIEKSASESVRRIEELEAQGAKLSQEAESLRGRIAELTAERDRLSAEGDDLRAEIEALRAKVEEFGSAKSDLAELELAAHRRADDYEAEAKRRADEYEAEAKARIETLEAESKQRTDGYDAEMRTRLRETLEGCRSQCELILATINETCGSVSDELRRTTDTISRLPNAFNSLRHDLDGFEDI